MRPACWRHAAARLVVEVLVAWWERWRIITMVCSARFELAVPAMVQPVTDDLAA